MAGVNPDLPQVACFDTAFHCTQPKLASMFALPRAMMDAGIRRYGFHGTSHRFVSRRVAERLGRADDPTLRVVTCHLGNGCSVAAIRGGRSVDTSMGFTPLEGLVMGTRSGDVDAAIVPHLMAKEELGSADVSALLNKHSGLLGVSGLSNDMRKLLEAEAAGNERARLAVDVFCYRLRKYIGAYVAALGGIDALVFTGGIGENAPAVRSRSVAGLCAMGIAVEEARNAQARGREAEISPDGGPASVQVIPTNEELLIARDTFRIVRGLPLG